jgi:DNA-binding IclR family transcriptional regulator
MRQPAKRRAPHGTTSLMVLDALVRLHTQGGGRLQVSRVELLNAVKLPETTVDDRLRTLVKEGRVLRVGRALYAPRPWPRQEQRRPGRRAQRN